jgi:ribose transport system permease protein
MGMVSITRGLAQYTTNGQSIFIKADSFRLAISQGRLFGIPVLLYWVALFLVVIYFLVSHTPFGRRIQAVGGNSEAALFSGIKVNRVKIIVYTVSGLIAAAAGFVTLSRLSSGLPTVGMGIEMDAIASAVLGGTGFNGEGGNILGTVLGALVIGTITNGLTVLGVDSYLQNVVKGVIIILTVVASVSLAKKSVR